MMMASRELRAILKQAEALSPEERQELLDQLHEQVAADHRAVGQRISLLDIAGIAPYPLLGEDAQEWVSRTRREGDEHRRKLLDEASGQ
ncbi:MAG TPA: hypothetical protein PLZ36_00490 [Armatimonadota bacterium]|nr:hypothetical protein [Armatimonadota bacterium]HOS43049.1 hypothetical protein [Armatimonadota bacterium]